MMTLTKRNEEGEEEEKVSSRRSLPHLCLVVVVNL